jgi:hypothetical protein
MREQTSTMRVVAGGFVVGLSLAATGCEVNNSDTADCADQVKLRGMVYSSHGFTAHAAQRYAAADRADCQDTGTDAPGSAFPNSPDQVATWTFRGYPPGKVVGVRRGKSSFAVFVAGSVPPSGRERIYQALTDEKP